MILERVEIVGFRGINRLSLMLEQNNVLIGENAWGKSSATISGSRREISTGENIICILF